VTRDIAQQLPFAAAVIFSGRGTLLLITVTKQSPTSTTPAIITKELNVFLIKGVFLNFYNEFFHICFYLLNTFIIKSFCNPHLYSMHQY
jgi:hypothetical protein